MVSDYKVKHGLPSVKEALELLNTAYGEWGDEKMFEWKCNYPGTDRDNHYIYICQGSKLTAFARLYHRTLNTNRKQLLAVFRGNAAVHPDCRGQGQYKSLHKANEEYCRSENTDFVVTFNRKDNFSFKTASKKRWAYVELPLYLTILSPGKALKQYASPVINDNTIFKRLVSLCGDRFRVEVKRTWMSLSELAGKPNQDCKGITVHLSCDAFHKLIGLVSNGEGIRKITRQMFFLLVQNEISLFQSIGSDPVKFSMGAIEVIPPGTHTEDDIEQIVKLYYSTVYNSNIVHFRRNSDDVDHMLRHPNLMGTLYLERNNEFIGFAPLYVAYTGDVREARVSDLVCVDAKAERELTEAIVAFCQKNKMDVIAMFSDKPLGSQWVRIRRHVLMWDELRDSGQGVDLRHLKLGFYDVV